MDDSSDKVPKDYEVRELGAKNRLHIPEGLIKDEDIGWKEGDKLAIFKQGRHIVIARLENPGIKLAVFGSMMAIMMIWASVNLPGQQVAYGQLGPSQEPEQATAPPEVLAQFNATQGPQEDLSPRAQTITLQAMSAYVPNFRIEVTYPSGQSKIENATHLSPVGNFGIKTLVGFPTPGTSVTTFNTDAIDTYTLQLGEVYDRALPPGSVINILAFSNGTQVYANQIEIKGTKFILNFQIQTSPAPHLPTAQELNALNEVHFDRIERKVDSQGRDIGQNTQTIAQMASAAYSTYGFHALAGISLFLIALTIYFNRHRIAPDDDIDDPSAKKKRRLDIRIGGRNKDDKEDGAK